MQLVPENSLSVFSKFTLNVATPCYVAYYTTESISMELLGAYWFYPVLGGALVAFSDMAGYAAGRLLGRGHLGTFRVTAGIPNWVFMAMAVCEPLYGIPGVRVVLLFNLGVTLYLWSFGMTSFRGGFDWRGIRDLFINPQLLAAVVGVILALFVPSLKGMERLGAEELAALPFGRGLVAPLWETVYLSGSTALPLSIMVIGLYLGSGSAAKVPSKGGGLRDLLLVLAFRLVVIPALVALALVALVRMGLPLGRVEFVVTVLILAMPPAVTCISIAEVYGGDSRLAARAILWGTLASLGTAPLVTVIAQRAYELASAAA